jgi:hypothetical protein
MRYVAPFLCALFALTIGASGRLSSQTQASASNAPRVSTLAGDGRAGFRDGDAAHAEFMLPSAVATGDDGRVYIADAGAQRIRLLYKGRVTTLAGGGTEEVGGLRIKGGYVDGPVLQARFNVPLGVAIGKGGDVYVADTYNHCIRRIHYGVVSAYAGAPDRIGAADGPPSQASFRFPRALSIDADGNLYVADYGVGIRKIGLDGTVSTLDLSDGGVKTYVGVSAVGRGKDLILYATNANALIVFSASARASKRSIFNHSPYAVFGLSDREALLTDENLDTISVWRDTATPLAGEIAYDIAGPSGDRDAPPGYRDGLPHEARFDTPSGIAITREGQIIVADAGNRRIRLLSDVALRGPVSGDLDALTHWPSNSYRIVFVSNSFAFWNVDWDGSIGGRLERGLTADMAQIGLTRKPRVEVARIDQGSVTATASYVNEILAEEPVDLVIIMLNYFHAYVEGNALQILPKGLTEMDSRLRQNHARLFVVFQPSSEGADPVVYVGPRAASFGAGYDFDSMWTVERSMGDILRGSGVDEVDLSTDFQKYETGDRARPLFSRTDGHLSPYGNEFVAKLILRALEKNRPWTQRRPASSAK